MRIIVKRCKIWRGDWRDTAPTSDAEALASWGGLSNPNLGINIICPFCGFKYFILEGVSLKGLVCECGDLHVKSKHAVRKVNRLHRPSRKVSLYCSNCDWTGTWGRAESVRKIRENLVELCCPKCGFGLVVKNMDRVPRIIQNSAFC